MTILCALFVLGATLGTDIAELDSKPADPPYLLGLFHNVRQRPHTVRVGGGLRRARVLVQTRCQVLELNCFFALGLVDRRIQRR
jgi:hypothetical protein